MSERSARVAIIPAVDSRSSTSIVERAASCAKLGQHGIAREFKGAGRGEVSRMGRRTGPVQAARAPGPYADLSVLPVGRFWPPGQPVCAILTPLRALTMLDLRQGKAGR